MIKEKIHLVGISPEAEGPYEFFQCGAITVDDPLMSSVDLNKKYREAARLLATDKKALRGLPEGEEVVIEAWFRK